MWPSMVERTTRVPAKRLASMMAPRNHLTLPLPDGFGAEAAPCSLHAP